MNVCTDTNKTMTTGTQLLDIGFTSSTGADNQGTASPVSPNPIPFTSSTGMDLKTGNSSTASFVLPFLPNLSEHGPGEATVWDMQFEDVRCTNPLSVYVPIRFGGSVSSEFFFPFQLHMKQYNLEVQRTSDNGTLANDLTVVASRANAFAHPTEATGKTLRVSFAFYDNGKFDIVLNGNRQVLRGVLNRPSANYANMPFTVQKNVFAATFMFRRMRIWRGPIAYMESHIMPSIVNMAEEYGAVIAIPQSVTTDQPDAWGVTGIPSSGQGGASVDESAVWIDSRLTRVLGEDNRGRLDNMVQSGYKIPFPTDDGMDGISGTRRTGGLFRFGGFPSITVHREGEVSVVDLLLTDLRWTRTDSTGFFGFLTLHRGVAETGNTDHFVQLRMTGDGKVIAAFTPLTGSSKPQDFCTVEGVVPKVVIESSSSDLSALPSGTLRLVIVYRQAGVFDVYANGQLIPAAGTLPTPAVGIAAPTTMVVTRNPEQSTWRLRRMRVWRGAEEDFQRLIRPSAEMKQQEYGLTDAEAQAAGVLGLGVPAGGLNAAAAPTAATPELDNTDWAEVRAISISSAVLLVLLVAAVWSIVQYLRSRRVTNSQKDAARAIKTKYHAYSLSDMSSHSFHPSTSSPAG